MNRTARSPNSLLKSLAFRPGSLSESHSCSGTALLLAQNQVHDPAAPDVWPRPSAMAQDFLVVASGLLQGVGQLRHPVEGSLIVVRAGQFNDGGRQPSGIDGDRSERVGEDVSED